MNFPESVKTYVVRSHTSNKAIENIYNTIVMNKYRKAITPKIIQLQCKRQLQVLQSFNKQKAIKTVVIVKNNVVHIAAVNP